MLPVLLFFAAITLSDFSGYRRPDASAETDRYTVRSSDPAVSRAAHLLNVSQPSQALDLLRAALELHPRDAEVLLLAGLAAYRSDQLHEALHYWSQSLDLAPNDA